MEIVDFLREFCAAVLNYLESYCVNTSSYTTITVDFIHYIYI